MVTRQARGRKTWAADPEPGNAATWNFEDDQAFWTWAAVEVLRLTGCRIEEVLEISHHSLIQYRLPSTGEIVPLLQIIPSKTDEERLLVVSPELADVLSAIIQRIRQPDGKSRSSPSTTATNASGGRRRRSCSSAGSPASAGRSATARCGRCWTPPSPAPA